MFKQTRKLLPLILLASLLTTHFSTLHAQQTTDTALQLLQPVNGAISDAQAEQRWTFNAIKGQRLSLRMQATSGNLDPYIELLDSSGKMLMTSTGSSYRNVTIDAFTVPDSATYTVRATRAQSAEATSGAYTLSLLPGFGFLLLNDPTLARASLRTWKQANALSQIGNGKLRLQLTSDNNYTFTTADRIGVFKDVYMQINMQPEPLSPYWEGGILIRGVRRETALEFYLFFLNSDGKWKLSIGRANGLTNIQDWTPLPGGLQSQITPGVMAKDSQITLFYNGQPLTEITDSSLADPGLVGVAVGTSSAPNNATSILFDNMVVTLPSGSAEDTPVLVPPKLEQWQRAAMPIIEELQAARIVPGVGKPGFDENTAFVTNNTAGGIVYQPMAKSLSFTDLVYTADVTWDSSNDNIACALKFRATDDNNFTIFYFDRKGGYGVRQVSDKEVVASFYNLSDAIKKDNRANNRVTLIAIGNGLIVYVNGVLVVDTNVKQASGGAQLAAYNYDRASSLCQFKNIWLRSFDR